MSDVTHINGVSSPAITPLARAGYKEAAAAPGPVRLGDKVEISRASQFLSKLLSQPDVRDDLVSRVKNEIAQGRYETPEKIDAALDELLTDLA